MLHTTTVCFNNFYLRIFFGFIEYCTDCEGKNFIVLCCGLAQIACNMANLRQHFGIRGQNYFEIFVSIHFFFFFCRNPCM